MRSQALLLFAAFLMGCGEPTVPFVAPDSGPNAVAVTAGAEHTCGLAPEGVAWCWGRNSSGQLGVGGTEHAPSPQLVAGDVTFALLEGGFEHTCGIDTDGGAWCWGDNSFGQLGDGTTELRETPTRVLGLTGVAGIAAGGLHTCAWTTGGAAYCWGDNRTGQLGDGTTTNRTSPVEVVGFSAATMDAGLFSTCAADLDHAVHCWGDNADGIIHGSTDSISTGPVVLPLVPFAHSVIVGQNHACASGLDDRTYCWGANDRGQHGQGTQDPVNGVSPVIGFLPFETVDAGSRSGHSCGAAQGTFYCWGSNRDAQIRVGDETIPRPVPIRILGIFVDSAAGRVHSCTLERSGNIICWGDNRWGQIGVGPNAFGQAGVGPRRIDLGS